MSERTTLMVTAKRDPKEMDSAQAYLKGVLPLLKGAGGKRVKRQKVNRVINGNPSGMALVMDFDPAEAIAGMFASEGYAPLIPLRDKGFSEMNIMLARKM